MKKSIILLLFFVSTLNVIAQKPADIKYVKRPTELEKKTIKAEKDENPILYDFVELDSTEAQLLVQKASSLFMQERLSKRIDNVIKQYEKQIGKKNFSFKNVDHRIAKDFAEAIGIQENSFQNYNIYGNGYDAIISWIKSYEKIKNQVVEQEKKSDIVKTSILKSR